MVDEQVALRQLDAEFEVLSWNDIYGPDAGRGDREIRLTGDETLESIVAYRYSWFETILAEAALTEAVLARIRGLLA